MKPKNYQPRHKRESTGRRFNGRKAIDALYDETWESYRRKFLAINGRCYACGEKATVVDHITAHKGSVQLFWKEDNFLCLCKKDHDRVTAMFDMKYRSGNSIDPKLRWLKQRREDTGTSLKVKIVPFDKDLLLKIQKLKE